MPSNFGFRILSVGADGEAVPCFSSPCNINGAGQETAETDSGSPRRRVAGVSPVVGHVAAGTLPVLGDPLGEIVDSGIRRGGRAARLGGGASRGRIAARSERTAESGTGSSSGSAVAGLYFSGKAGEPTLPASTAAVHHSRGRQVVFLPDGDGAGSSVAPKCPRSVYRPPRLGPPGSGKCGFGGGIASGATSAQGFAIKIGGWLPIRPGMRYK
jgi:hypothetical protein